MHPVAIAFAIVILVGVAGVIAYSVRNTRTFAGYAELIDDARAIQKTLKGEIFRDGNDLVVSGNYRKLPTVVRFSYDQNTPGLNIQMKAAASFQFTVVPKGSQVAEGRNPMRTPDDLFDARFSSRTDHPTLAKMFFQSRAVMTHLNKLLCSSSTFFNVHAGGMELSELVIPASFPGRHVLFHLESLGTLAGQLAAMPGAHKIKVEEMQGEASWLARGAVAVGVVAALVVVVVATQERSGGAADVAAIAADLALPQGVLPVDAPQMVGVDEQLPEGKGNKWRVATEQDFAPVAKAWLRGSGRSPSGRVTGNFSGSGSGRDAGYILVNQQDGTRRVVLLAGGQNRYDAQYPDIAVAAALPKRLVGSIEWVGGKPPEDVDGDGLLLVRERNNPASALVLFTSGSRIVSAVPVNYQLINLE
ncbi:MAG: hypothetical protein ACRD2R_04705 [Terriglobales bacterium]